MTENTTPRVSVAVMAHPKREQWIPKLVERLGVELEVVWDQKNDRWDTGRRAVLAADPAATHHLVVQDDAIVCRDLVAGVAEALKRIPAESPVALYMGRVRPKQRLVTEMIERAKRRRASFIRMEGPWWGVGIVIPTKLVEAVVAWGDRHPHVQNYDTRLSRFFGEEGIPCFYTVPSLVEHRNGHENPSLVNGRTSLNRRAWRFIGEDRSALEAVWDGPVVSPGEDNQPEDDTPPITVRSQFGRVVVDPKVWDLLTDGVLIDEGGEPMLVSKHYHQSVYLPRHGRRP